MVGRFADFAPAIWLYAGRTLSIAPRLTAITPDLEQGDHLRHRQLSAVILIAASPLAIAMSLVNSRVALWALALNFAGPLLTKWSRAQPVTRTGAAGE